MVIGITGGIATGKSTVTGMIRRRGFTVIDADVIARQVVEPGERAWRKIIETFGEEILFNDGSINRKKLGQIVFHDGKWRKKLNEIVHPEVRSRMAEETEAAFRKGERTVFLDIPLLFESGMERLVDKVLVVYADEGTQLLRLMERDGLREEEALARIRSQLPIEEKKKKADAVIDNRFSPDETERQLEKILHEWNIL